LIWFSAGDNYVTPKEKRFVAEYLNGQNATKAAIAAGYAPRSAAVTGSRLLRKAHIRQAVQTSRKHLEEATLFKAEQVLAGWIRHAVFDIKELFDEGGKPLPLHKLREDVRLSLAGCEIRISRADHDAVVEVHRYRIPDRLRALDSLGKFYGLLKEGSEKRYQNDEEAKSDVLSKLTPDELKAVRVAIDTLKVAAARVPTKRGR
jgi:phage terminase small subunit